MDMSPRLKKIHEKAEQHEALGEKLRALLAEHSALGAEIEKDLGSYNEDMRDLKDELVKARQLLAKAEAEDKKK